MGVPVPQCNFAHVYVNGQDMGVYANVETIKKQFLVRTFGDDIGNLYEGTAADLRTGFTSRIEKKTNQRQNDWTDVNTFIDIIEAPDDVFSKKIDTILNITAFIRFTIAEAMVAHWDGFGGNQNNYYFYHDPVTDKFFFIPWGVDGTFQNYAVSSYYDPRNPQTIFTSSFLNRRFYTNPRFRSEYRETMRILVNEIWDTKEFLAEFDRMKSLISGLIKMSSMESYDIEVESTRTFIKNRKFILLAELDAYPRPLYPLEIPENPTCARKMGTVSLNAIVKWGTSFTNDISQEYPCNCTTKANFDGNEVQLLYIGAQGGTYGEYQMISIMNGFSKSPREMVIFALTIPLSYKIESGTVIKTDDLFFLLTVMHMPDLTDPGNVVPMGYIAGGEITIGKKSNLILGGAVYITVKSDIWVLH